MLREIVVRHAGAVVLALPILGWTLSVPNAQPVSDLAACADEAVKTAVLPRAKMAKAEAACSRVLASGGGDVERQKAAFFRGLMRFLQVMQAGVAQSGKADGSVSYAPPTLAQVRPALADVESAIGLEGPLKGEALTLRATINQTIGRHADALADAAEAMQTAPGDATPLVQRALEHERTGDINAALADLDRALELDPNAGTALSARGDLLRRLGYLVRARADLAAAAALGPPFRRLALTRKSELELRAGDLRAAYEDLLAASRETDDMPKDDAAAASAALFVHAGDLALDKLKDADTAERLYRESARLAPRNWNSALGLARVEEVRGNRPGAEAIYKRILAGTRSTQKLLERILASWRLKQLTRPALRSGAGPFRSGLDSGMGPSKASPDGLQRVAFLIGSSDYAELASLPNARRDAAVMANALTDMGFDTVEIAENLGKVGLRGVPSYVAARAAEADIALVFYAGHGVETGGINYLVPVDAALESDRELQQGALALTDLTIAAAKARRGSLVIVDACRDDPFVEARAVALSRAANRENNPVVPTRIHAGLAAVSEIVPNNVVFHSTQPGQIALDGDGLDSPFVRALLETLSAPGRSFGHVVQETITRVSDSTQGRQVPAAYGTAPTVALLPREVAR